MHPILRNILAVIAGILVGGGVNMGIINIGMTVLPLPGGIGFEDPEFSTVFLNADLKYFISPFLAHAVGTLAGAFVAAKIAASRQLNFALIIGVVFLYGGYQMSTMIDGPLWFDVLDLGAAYLPMGWLGWKLAGAKS